MLIVNGLKFAKNASELASSLFHAGGTAHGLYKVRRRRKSEKFAIELFRPSGEPAALISPDCVFVTAHRSDGKTFYMFGMTVDTKQWLRLDSVDSRQLFKIALDARAQVIGEDEK